MESSHICIAHISDVHFGLGAGLTTSYNKKVGKWLLSDLKKENPDILIVSGDLTVGAFHGQFKAAYKYIEKMISQTRLTWRSIVVIPGNHDDQCRFYGAINVPLGRVLNNFNKTFKIKKIIPLKYIGPNQVDCYVPFPLTKPKILIFGISSIEGGYFAQGEISEDSIDWMFDKVKNYHDRDVYPIPIISVHHHPTSVPGVTQRGSCVLRNDADFINDLKPLGNALVLHGHQHSYWPQEVFKILHSNGTKILYIISSGTSTGRPFPKTLTNQYNIIKLSELTNRKWKVEVNSRILHGKSFVAGSSDNFSISV